MSHRPALLLLVLLAGCTADAAAAPVVDAVRPTIPTSGLAPAPSPALLGDVRSAYDRSWAVHAAAVGRLDPSGLPSAFGESALILVRREVAALSRDGAALRVRIEHHVEVALIDAETAVVTDELVDRSVRVDAETREPLEPARAVRSIRASTLRREGGTWTVTELAVL